MAVRVRVGDRRPSRRRLGHRCGLALVGVLAATCSKSDPPGPSPDGGASLDAGPDAAVADAGLDAAVPDGGPDAGPDDVFDDCGAEEPVPRKGGPGCATVDRECPAERPHPGGPCEGELSCEYVDAATGTIWLYDCTGGAWSVTADDESTPPLAELCLDPFQGTLDGGFLEIGPAQALEPFRPFHDCERVFPRWGPQGGAMIPVRLRVTGVDAPECVIVRLTLRRGVETSEPTAGRVALHCGESLAVFALLPWECGQQSVDLRVEAEVEGIASATARIRVPTVVECGGNDN